MIKKQSFNRKLHFLCCVDVVQELPLRSNSHIIDIFLEITGNSDFLLNACGKRLTQNSALSMYGTVEEITVIKETIIKYQYLACESNM